MLRAEGLCKRWRRRVAVADVSLSVAPGEIVGLLGPNGAGKTTCFYMMVGLVAPDSGRIFLDDRDITELAMYRRARLGLGYLAQEASIFRNLSAAENVMAALELRNDLGDEQRQEALETLVSELELTACRDTLGVRLSGGERRRTEIARALAARPRYVLLDEPFAGVDPVSVAEIQRRIELLRARGLGVLITDHNVRETLRICHRACILNEGRILAAGTPAELVEDEQVRRVYLGAGFSL